MNIDKLPIKLKITVTHIPSGRQWASPPKIVNTFDEYKEILEVCAVGIDPDNNKFSLPIDELHQIYIPRGILQESIIMAEIILI